MLRLLCALAHADLTQADCRAIASGLATPQLDFNALRRSLDVHGLTPLAHRHLVLRTGFDVPAAFAAQLSATFRRRAANQAQLLRLLRQLLSAFDAAGVDVRPYKGPVLAIQLYGHYAMRQYSDIDLLVRPEQAEEATRVLLQANVIHADQVSADWDAYVRRMHHARAYREQRTGIPIELHWRLIDAMYALDVPLEWLMEAPETVFLNGQPAKAMCGERLLLALCLHGAMHQWERLSWLAEVAEIVRSPQPLDWSEIADRAASLRFTRELGAALILIRNLLNADVSGVVPGNLVRDAGADRLSRRIAARLSRVGVGKVTATERLRLGWVAREGWRQRVAFTWRVATRLSAADLAMPGSMLRFTPTAVGRRALRLIRTELTNRRRPR